MSLLPPHVLDNVKGRIHAAVHRNPAVSSGHLDTLEGMGAYFDFRELQDVMTAKSLWRLFESRFGTKETLSGRCDQLAELRNTIRHSRPLNDVTRKDGEAALMWFGQVLDHHDLTVLQLIVLDPGLESADAGRAMASFTSTIPLKANWLRIAGQARVE